jgi:hypothetical protein
MGSLISGITDALGLTNTGAAKDAANAAANASAQGLAMSKEQIAFAKDQLDFQKQQYGDWKNIYGDVQKNVGDYYKNLTPEKLTAMGLQNQQSQFQQVDTQIKREMAQKGLTGSGTEAAVLTSNDFANASAKATIRTNAPQQVAEQKMQFVGIGLNQGTQELGIIGNSAANVTNSFSNAVNSRTSIAGSYLNSATSLMNQNSQNMTQIANGFSFGTTGGGFGQGK